MEAPTNELAKALAAFLKRHFRKKFAYVAPYPYSPDELKEATALYKKWSTPLRLIPVLLYFVLPVIYGWLLNSLYVFSHSLFTKSPDIFFPQYWPAFIFPGVLLGLATTDHVAEYIQRILMRGKYDAFVDYANRLEGFDNKSSWRYFARLLLVPFVIMFVWVSTSSLVASPGQFTLREVFGIRAHTYKYSQVRKVTYFQNYINEKQQKYPDPHYKIFFVDNTSFGTDWYFGDATSAAPFIQILLNNKAPIDTIETDNG